MTSTPIVHPGKQLGREIDELLDIATPCTRITFVSAFVALRAILRLRDKLLVHARQGCQLRFVVGIDLSGTSRDVLKELLRWNCEVFIFHNPLEHVTFHPKIYMFERESAATLIVGSNNLTDGGFYTNYEAAVRHDFKLPGENETFHAFIEPLQPFLKPQGGTVQCLTRGLIDLLSARGELPSEQEARIERKNRSKERVANQVLPDYPFKAEKVPLPPQMPSVKGSKENHKAAKHAKRIRPAGELVWRKVLSPSDALVKKAGTHPVGSMRLTQAKFKTASGTVIDQTTYFRELFGAFDWERERGKHTSQERTFVPIRVFIKDSDHGVQNFEISHDPTREAGQGNFTTVIRWGREFSPVIQDANLSGATLSLYATPDADAPFMIDIR
jgi:hypothetical protein